MSRREWKFLVTDILDAIARIQSYVAGMTSSQFASDNRTIDAVVRNFIVIGEAAGQIPEQVSEQHPEIPWRVMRDMRNFAVHHYWGVETEVVWQTIQRDLPPLVPSLKAVIAD